MVSCFICSKEQETGRSAGPPCVFFASFIDCCIHRYEQVEREHNVWLNVVIVVTFNTCTM
jgi:hypothetical protein